MKYVFEDMDVEVLQDKVVDDVNYDIQDNKLISKQTLCSTISSSIYNYPDGFSLYLKFDESGLQTMVSVMLAVYAAQTEKCLGTFIETASVTIKRYENNFILKMEDEANSQGSLVFVTVKENGDIVKVVQNYTQLVNFEIIENKYVVVNTYEKLNEKFKIWVVGVYQLSGKPYKVFIDKKFNNTVTCITETIIVRGGRKMVYIGKIKKGKKKRTGLFDLKIKVPVPKKKNSKKNVKHGWFYRWMQARKKKKSTIEKLKEENKQKEEELEELKQKVKTQKIKLMKDNPDDKDSLKKGESDSEIKETEELDSLEVNSSKGKKGKKTASSKSKKDKQNTDDKSNLDNEPKQENKDSSENDSKLDEKKKEVKSKKKEVKDKNLTETEQENVESNDFAKEETSSNIEKVEELIDKEEDNTNIENKYVSTKSELKESFSDDDLKIDIDDIESSEEKSNSLQDDVKNEDTNTLSQEKNSKENQEKLEENLSSEILDDENKVEEPLSSEEKDNSIEETSIEDINSLREKEEIGNNENYISNDKNLDDEVEIMASFTQDEQSETKKNDFQDDGNEVGEKTDKENKSDEDLDLKAEKETQIEQKNNEAYTNIQKEEKKLNKKKSTIKSKKRIKKKALN